MGEQGRSPDSCTPGDGLHSRLHEIIERLVADGLPLSTARDEFEKQYILAGLRRQNGALARSAKHLGIHRNTLRNKVAAHGIVPKDYSESSR